MILMYHKIFPESPTMWWVNPDAFWRQLETLRRYEVVYLDQYNIGNPKQAVITFDGVYENVFTFAFPILKKFGYPFELFIVGDTVGKGNEFDQPVEPPARFASKEQLQKMVQEGGRLQWHSRSHKDLTKMNPISLAEEELAIPPEFQEMDSKGFRWFAYPHGKHTPQIIALTKKSFSGALSCEAGNDQDRFQLNRVTMMNSTQFKSSTVSVIIPNYNYGHLLSEAVESVLRQTVPPDEILFIDDASQDNSLEVAERYKGKIKIIKNEKNLGIIANFNKAVSLTQGDYISFLGADNRFRSDYIERCKLALDQHPNCAIAYTNAFLFGSMAEVFAQRFGARPLLNSREFFLWEFPAFSDEAKRNLRYKNIIHGSSMYRRKAFEQVGGYRDSHGPEDQNLFACMLEKGWAAILCKDYLLEYRHHSNQQDCTRRISAMEVAQLRGQIKEKDALIRQLALTLQKYKQISGKKESLNFSHSLSSALSSSESFVVQKGKPRTIAFYLPQFHPIPENDIWWGKGFTEWTNVAKAKPLFPGHYQPHIPADLGFYDLRLPEARRAQVEMARQYGIYGFCYYHYWFQGKLLLEKPIQEIVKMGEPEFPFCLCWANEDWTRAWDGRNRDVLMKQEYNLEDDRRHIRYLLQIFEDRRYIRIKGKPLFLVYRPSQLPDPAKTMALWREEARRCGIGELYLCQVERFPEDMGEPSRRGFDAAVEFQPDGVNLDGPLPDIGYGQNKVFSYQALVRAALSKPIPKYLRYPCVTPSWDNSPRKDKNAIVFIDSTPQLYEEWIRKIIDRQKDCDAEENLIFINAMNEWGEGCHLEPDLRFGKAYLEATKRALGLEDPKFVPAPQTVLSHNRNQGFADLGVELPGKIGGCQPSVSVIIPVYNKLEFTRKCLAALWKTPAGGINEIIIVNNGSTDDTASYLNSLNGGIKIISNSKNQGFAAACNQGASLAAYRYLLFLNNDTEPFQQWIDPLVTVLNRDPHVAAVGSKLLFPGGSIQHAGVVIVNDQKIKDPLVARHLYYQQPSDFPEANQIRTYQALTAACLLVRKNAFEAVGGFDEKYWNGYEDIDLCFKLQEKNWKLVYHPESVLIHHESISGPERFTKIPENIRLLHHKWLGKIKPDLVIEEDGNVRKTENESIKIYQIPKSSLPMGIGRTTITEKGMISIVMLTFNQLKFTQKCVQSIQRHTPEKYELIFVDNGSSDGTQKLLEKQIRENPHYQLIKNETNLGYAKGCNLGMAAARGEYILLLNNDVVVTPEWLSGMLECLNSDRKIGIIGPMTNEISGIQKVAQVPYQVIDKLDEFARNFRERNLNRRIPSRRIVGFCMLFRRELVDQIGTLDESFGTGNFEDDDFCLRTELAGFKNFIAGDVFIHHFGSRTFIGNKIPYGEAMKGNQKIFREKWGQGPPQTPEEKKYLALRAIEEARMDCNRDQFKKAVDRLLAVIKLGTEGDEGYFALSEILLEGKQYEKAFEVLMAIPSSTADERKLVLLGYSREGMSHLEEAFQSASEALSLNAKNAQALNLLGILAYRKQNVREAILYFQEAIAADKGYGEPYSNLGVIRWEANQKEEALNLFEKGFILSPAISESAQLYHSAITEGGEYLRAEPIFREAKALHPSHKRIHFLLIDLLLKQENYVSAMEEIMEAMIRFGTDEGMLQAAAEVRKKIGPQEKSSQGLETGISLCMIVKNEEKFLPRCLQSARPIVDEMIVVDTGSSDRTKDIGTAFGAKIFDCAWEDDFSGPRNFSLSKARGNWILVLDADELISAQDYQALVALTPKGSRKVAYSMITRNYANSMDMLKWTANDGSYGEEAGSGWFPSEKVRLFPRNPRIHFENPVHEFVEPSLERNHIPIEKCRVPIHHYGKLNASKEQKKGEEYFSLGRKKLYEKKSDIDSLKELAVQANILGRYQEAIELWNQVIQLQPNMAEAYINLTAISMSLEKYQDALVYSRKALDLDPDCREAVLNHSIVEFTLGNIQNVVELLEANRSNFPDYPLALSLLSVAYIILGEKEKSLNLIKKIREMGFNDKEYHQNTAKRLIAMGRDQEAKSIFDMMKEIDPEAKGRDNPLRKFGIMEENGKFFEKGTEYH